MVFFLGGCFCFLFLGDWCCFHLFFWVVFFFFVLWNNVAVSSSFWWWCCLLLFVWCCWLLPLLGGVVSLIGIWVVFETHHFGKSRTSGSPNFESLGSFLQLLVLCVLLLGSLASSCSLTFFDDNFFLGGAASPSFLWMVLFVAVLFVSCFILTFSISTDLAYLFKLFALLLMPSHRHWFMS